MLNRLLPALALTVMLTACGRSPLLHHDNAQVPQDARIRVPEAPRAACELKFEQSKLCVTYEWDAPPAAKAEGAMWIHLTELETGAPVSADDQVDVEPWMPSMGHGSIPVQVAQTATGKYRVTRIFFTMKGEWDVRLQIKKGGELVDQVVVPIKL